MGKVPTSDAVSIGSAQTDHQAIDSVSTYKVAVVHGT